MFFNIRNGRRGPGLITNNRRRRRRRRPDKYYLRYTVKRV